MGDAWRVDQTRHHAIRTDAAARVLLRDHPRELDQRGLADAIRQVRIADIAQPRHRGNRDDGTPAPLDHRRQHLLRRQQQASHVHVVGRIEIPHIGIQKPAGLADANVVMQHIDGAEVFARLREQARDLRLFRHVADEGLRRATLGANQRRRLRGRGGVAVHHADAGAKPGIGHAGGAPDAPAGARRSTARHEHGAVRQTERQRIHAWSPCGALPT
jgi:hypothetical protein